MLVATSIILPHFPPDPGDTQRTLSPEELLYGCDPKSSARGDEEAQTSCLYEALQPSTGDEGAILDPHRRRNSWRFLEDLKAFHTLH